MRYVLGASAAICWVLPRPLAPRALRLREDFRNRVHELIAPSIFPAEIAGALTKSERQRILPVGQSRLLLADVLSTPPTLHPYEPLLLQATDISSRTRIAVNDCLYVALAEREGCPLVTADDKLLRNLRPIYPLLVDLANL